MSQENWFEEPHVRLHEPCVFIIYMCLMANRPVEHYGTIILTNSDQVYFLGKRPQKNFFAGPHVRPHE